MALLQLAQRFGAPRKLAGCASSDLTQEENAQPIGALHVRPPAIGEPARASLTFLDYRCVATLSMPSWTGAQFSAGGPRVQPVNDTPARDLRALRWRKLSTLPVGGQLTAKTTQVPFRHPGTRS